ncbi:MAG TPA: glycosyltransferase [Polyangiales bacterium]
MKVVDLTEFYSQRGGGVRSYLTAKAQAARALGHDHLVIAPGPSDSVAAVGAGGPGRSRLRLLRGPSLPYDPTYQLFYRVRDARRAVLAERPDVLELHSPYLAALTGLSVPRSGFGIRTFVWHADFIDTYLRTMLERGLPTRAIDGLLEPLWASVRRIAGGCDATIVAARWQVDKLRHHGVPNVVHVPFGVDREQFSTAARDASERAKWLVGAAPNAKLLVGIGRFAVEKRWDVVLDAFEELRRTHAAVLVLYGDGPDRARLEQRCVGRTDVHFPGFVSDRARLATGLASADLLVHGCPFETFGLGVAEAMSTGLPAVVPDAGGAAELVDESCGEHYRAGDAHACAAAIVRALARDPANLREGALRAMAQRVPTVRGHFEQLFALYAELLARRAARG